MVTNGASDASPIPKDGANSPTDGPNKHANTGASPNPNGDRTPSPNRSTNRQHRPDAP